MKRSILLLATLAIISTGCAQENKTGNSTEVKKEVPAMPEHAKISDQELQGNVAKTMEDDFAYEETESTRQAIDILKETNNVLEYIATDKDKKAKEELAKLIGELEILITKDPKAAFVPVNTAYEVHDVVVDIPSANKITEAAKKAMEDNHYQAAKDLLEDLTSEFTVRTTYLPLATYPDAMRLSGALLDKGKKEEATAILVRALNTLVVDKVDIPLPVLRAEEYIKLASKAMKSEEKDKKESAKLYLDNADYQLQLAEAMGYGSKDKEYKELAENIKQLKETIDKDEESKDQFDKLSDKIKKFKERLFFKKQRDSVLKK